MRSASSKRLVMAGEARRDVVRANPSQFTRQEVEQIFAELSHPRWLDQLAAWERAVRRRQALARKRTPGQCRRGHPWDGANTYTYRGRRYCRACRAEAAREAYRRRKR